MNKMNVEDIKGRIKTFICNTIDLYMPPTNIMGKMQNATAKLYLNNNFHQIGKIVDAFKDENDEIDTDEVIKTYEDTLFDNGELRFDIKTILPSDMEWLKTLLPNKIILFKKGDLQNIFS